MPQPNKALTYGEESVGKNFNPSGNADVDVIKKHYATVIDYMDVFRAQASNPEVKRICSIAITEAQTAQMWAVKAVTHEL